MAQNLTNQHAEILTGRVEKRLNSFSDQLADSLKELTKSIDIAGQEAAVANKRLHWLNFVLVFATIVGAVATFVLAWQAAIKMGWVA